MNFYPSSSVLGRAPTSEVATNATAVTSIVLTIALWVPLVDDTLLAPSSCMTCAETEEAARGGVVVIVAVAICREYRLAPSCGFVGPNWLITACSIDSQVGQSEELFSIRTSRSYCGERPLRITIAYIPRIRAALLVLVPWPSDHFAADISVAC